MSHTCVAHDTDYDGFAAAWAAKRALGQDAEYVPHGDFQEVPGLSPGGTIYLLDHSYEPEKLKALTSRHREVVVIDHHRSYAEQYAESNLSDDAIAVDHAKNGSFIGTDVSGLTYRYDVNKSACVLAWEHFHQDQPLPFLLEIIQDYDLWNWEYPQTEAVAVAMDQIGLSYELFHCSVRELQEIGKPMVDYRDGLLRRWADRADVHTCSPPGLDRELDVAFVNATMCRSNLATRIAEETGVEVIVMYRVHSADKVHLSLRARNGSDVDVSKIGKALGGGGHAGAGGCDVGSVQEIREVFLE